MLPISVLEKAQSELCCYGDSGCSVMEMSHRSRSYKNIFDQTEEKLRRIMDIPDDYSVLFLQGGATTQFSMVPMNLAYRGQKSAYAVTGTFAKKAYAEALRWTDAYKITDGADGNFSSIPEIIEDNLEDDLAYLHITGNNTTCGTMYHTVPKHKNIPLVADWSSGILGKKIDVKDYDLIYAGAQKNIGIAGLTVVIVKRSLIRDDIDGIVPSIMRYADLDKAGSMLNTPPTYAIYLSGLVFDWIEENGGINAMEEMNIKKSNILYDIIDSSSLYKGTADKKDRSIMNITFTLPNEELTTKFLEMAEERNMVNLKGYRSIGGIRASIYNGMPIEGVCCLAQLMEDFEKEN